MPSDAPGELAQGIYTPSHSGTLISKTWMPPPCHGTQENLTSFRPPSDSWTSSDDMNDHRGSIPTIAEGALDTFRGVFYGSLAALARRGLAALPQDTLDLIHDFLAERWDKIRDRFDPSLGLPENYVFQAFYWFARKRIQDQRVQHAAAYGLGPQEKTDDSRARLSESLRGTVLHHLQKLPDQERTILSEYVKQGPSSVRQLADQFDLSRYAIRQILAQGLGRIAVALEEPGVMSTQGFGIAKLIWGENRSIESVAAMLGKTTEHVKNAHKQNTNALATALLSCSGGSTDTRMTENTETDVVSGLIFRVMNGETDAELAQSIRESRSEVIDFFDSDSVAGIQELGRQHPERIAFLYDALSSKPENAAHYEALLDAEQDEERRVGHAVVDLFSGVPALVPKLATLLDGCESVPDGAAAQLRQEVATRAALDKLPAEEILPLLDHALSPMTLWKACDSIGLLFQRILRHTKRTNTKFRIALSGSHVDCDNLTTARLVKLLTESYHLPESVAAALWTWFAELARFKPTMFRGFVCVPEADGLSIKPLESEMDPFERWRSADITSNPGSCVESHGSASWSDVD